jgi:hypothetical protein
LMSWRVVTPNAARISRAWRKLLNERGGRPRSAIEKSRKSIVYMAHFPQRKVFSLSPDGASGKGLLVNIAETDDRCRSSQ